MKDLLMRIYDAWAENTPYRYWSFDMNGNQKNINIKLYEKHKQPIGGLFYLDVNGLPAAIKFITDNLKK